MKLVHTTRWVTAGAAIGLSAALFAGVALAATPGQKIVAKAISTDATLVK
jgi:hypothetical protein